MSDAPTPHELARDMDQLERQFLGDLRDMKDTLGEIRRDTSQILAEQARVGQKADDHDRRIGRLETEQTNNRRMVVGSLLFPVIVIIVGALLASGGVS